uniref:Uncharacterized protein n=1 Tax=Strombidium rassoulzadegani TaxID=1082188 RepID=A0A7S3CVT9_9SPIT|mmetsp:Transcript_8565/g.14446  ORF Transcript_8565/g.14446 Transcript_8565/m.14446 type:complete len:101 (+) Transcript_8565:374-676(+)
MVNQQLRVSQVTDLNYKLSFLMASSQTGKNMVEQEEGGEALEQQPLDLQVTLSVQLREFPNDVVSSRERQVKFAAGKDKFLQLSRDLRDALEQMESLQIA